MTDSLFQSLIVILLAAALPTAIWRWAGVVAAGYLRDDSPWLEWVRAVATALIAAVIAKLVVFPTGALADISLIARFAAIGVGVLAFLRFRKSVLTGVVAAEMVLLAAAYLRL